MSVCAGYAQVRKGNLRRAGTNGRGIPMSERENWARLTRWCPTEVLQP
jgi:hypothetical protein